MYKALFLFLLFIGGCVTALEYSAQNTRKAINAKIESYQWCIDEIEMQYDKHEWEDMKQDCKEFLQ